MRKLETILATAMLAALALPAHAKCAPDALPVGAVCVDKYEASVWEVDPVAQGSLVKKLQKGKATVADLAGATQHGTASDDYGTACPDTGAGCTTFFAASVAGTLPAANLTWFQAAAACRNAGKRLLTNQEWQMAALGTPDPGTDNGTTDCAISTARANTGSRSSCISNTGHFDMVGNVAEWVADWADNASGSCTTQTATYGADATCSGGDGSTAGKKLPAAVIRGGSNADATGAGVFAFYANYTPSTLLGTLVGFRCAR